MDKQIDRQIVQIHRYRDRQIQIDRQINRKIDRQIDRQIYRQKAQTPGPDF